MSLTLRRMDTLMAECATFCRYAVQDGRAEDAYRWARGAAVCAREVMIRRGLRPGRANRQTWARAYARLEEMGLV